MKPLIAIGLNQVKLAFYNWKRLLLYTLIPIIFLIFLSSGFNRLFEMGVYLEPFEVIIVNQDTHNLSSLLVYQIKEDKNLASLVNLTLLEREEEAENLVKEDRVVAAIVIPDGFINSLERGTNHSIKLMTSMSQPVKGYMIQSIMESYMKSVSAGQSAVNTVWDYYIKMGMESNERRDKIDNVINDITLRAYFVRANTIQKNTIPGVNSIPPIGFYGVSIVLVIVMLGAVAYGKQIFEDMKHRVTARIVLTGVQPNIYFLGKFLGLFIIGLIQGAAFFGPIAYILQVNYNIAWISTGAILLTTAFTVAALTMGGIVLIAQADRFQYIGSLMIFTSAIIGGGFIPYIYLPKFIKSISFLTLHYWVMGSVVSFSGSKYFEGLQSLLIVLLFGVVVLIAAYLRYNKTKGWQ